MRNHKPKVRDNSVTLQNDSSIVIDVFADVPQRNGDVLTVSAVSNPANGTVAIEADGTITYTPDPEFPGVGSFTYTIDDERGLKISKINISWEHMRENGQEKDYRTGTES